ncbi:ATP-grasp fold amidoligase family protein [Mucilaginibacter sp. CAU 1740]|uniref:ATP-grasp fold amidoligase family protein n=1 Tax=Mucilaginibacter sp. CAU 1740 TaxID=3140365 RepID=UPI00325B1CE8
MHSLILRSLVMPLAAAIDSYAMPFTKRIKYRHNQFWEPADAENIRNIPISRYDHIDQITHIPNWQRMLSNKANSLYFAGKMGCKVPEVYWKGRNIDDIDFSLLPKQFVIKPTIGHSCNNVYLMDDGYNHMDKQIYKIEDLRGVMTSVLQQSHQNEFIIEEFLRSEDGIYRIPLDYKVHTFNGEIACIEVIDRKAPSVGHVNVFDDKWNAVENIGKKFIQGDNLTPPHCLDEIISQCRALSKVYKIYVRIDFFATDKGAVFGEFTPTPGIGVGFTRKANYMLNRYWDTYCKGMI